MKTLEQRVAETICRAQMMAPGDRVGVAVSGGADSVALLRLLERLREELGITLVVVHFDHQLRGAESEADAQFTADLARTRGLEFILDREDVAAAAAKHKWNLEEAARRLRYAFFERVVQEGRATRIAVAHTADDQAETVLAHLLRGTGPTGLGGIYPVVGAIVRPLLDERREGLRDYLRALGQTWREDLTNLDVRRMRAKIRSQLIPLLERDFSPRVTSHLVGLAKLAREEEEFWGVLVEDRFRALVKRQDAALRIRVRDLLSPLDLALAGSHDEREGAALPPLRALTERLIRRLYQEVRGSRQGLTATHVNQVLHLATEPLSGHLVELPGRIIVERVFDDILLSQASRAERPEKPGETARPEKTYLHSVQLPEHGETSVFVPELKRRFCLKVIDWPIRERDTKRREEEALDAERLRGPLVLRNWRPGDAYRARGCTQAKKIKRMFLAQRVPLRDRAGWPVLESAGRVVWARGMAPAEEFCARDGTRVGVIIEEERL
ncbi:MAG TPA: tRNA lysidine(34) synthetase TilS [Candidatus Acidoferrales bacterium]|nr:tRNA lysidine(34) synthetase TilS [Candidatus Acidoferrales bacterium]